MPDFKTKRQKISRLMQGLWHALVLNLSMLSDRIAGRRVLVIHLNAASQWYHLVGVVQRLLESKQSSEAFGLYLLTARSECYQLDQLSVLVGVKHKARPEQSARLLLFCDMFLSVDQGMVFPFLGCQIRACSFHGQPSKANVYQRFNYRQINALFFYGPLMKDHYYETKAKEPDWPLIRTFDVGQPLSDHRINLEIGKKEAKLLLGLDQDKFTVIYAPSFEYCSSLAGNGEEIINAILSRGVNLIIKPHPAFYNNSEFLDNYNRNIPNIRNWSEKVSQYDSREDCVFSYDNSLDMGVALAASDVMLTDFSGVAFDGFLKDLGLIFWNCEDFYSEYLPQRYGVSEDAARSSLACNVGRDYGVVVNNSSQLIDALEFYRRNPGHLAQERRQVREKLLFNPGRATQAMTRVIVDLLGLDVNDR